MFQTGKHFARPERWIAPHDYKEKRSSDRHTGIPSLLLIKTYFYTKYDIATISYTDRMISCPDGQINSKQQATSGM